MNESSSKDVNLGLGLDLERIVKNNQAEGKKNREFLEKQRKQKNRSGRDQNVLGNNKDIRLI